VRLSREYQRQIIVAIVLMGVASILVSSTRRHAWAAEKQVRNRRDVYFLPPPEQVVRMSLGYKAALADVLWAYVLVSQGLHTYERRRFDNMLQLYDAINLLDPKWRTPYLLADALITFQTSKTPLREIIIAREILERGTRERPTDGEIWLNLGQFVSFVAPASYIEDDDPEMAARWRREGVAYLARAAELGEGWQSLGGASILKRAGKREAAIRFLKRAYAVTDDDELKDQIMMQLRGLMQEGELERYRRRLERFRKTISSDLPFIGYDTAIVLGPPPHPDACAGLDSNERETNAKCATDWRTWSERVEKED
jgi:tetratricopeptide (TPR) repeat protein